MSAVAVCDKDGKLSAAERAELREFVRQRGRNQTDGRQAERMTWKVAGLDREALVYFSLVGNSPSRF